MRHGCHAAWVIAFLTLPAARGDAPVLIASESFEVHYRVNEASLPLNSVVLWFTVDRGTTWTHFGPDPDAQSPIRFRAVQEGLHGFFFVLTNASGASGKAPETGTVPQLSVLVDYTPPTVQLHALRQTEILGKRAVRIRWTATDTDFTPRPVRLEYRRLPNTTWISVSEAPLENTGRHDWRPPKDLDGPIAVRLTVSDRVGHQVTTDPQTLEISRPRLRSSSETRRTGGANDAQQNPVGFVKGSSPRLIDQRSHHLFTQAIAYRERGQYRAGISRLREAVRLNPRWSEAFVEMGEMLYHVGDLDRSLNAYELALRQQPTMRRGLRGAAMIHRRQNDHETAAGLLRTILEANPRDAEVWINLGDIAVFQGNEVLARECYTRATLVDPSATQVRADAKNRLELMSTVSRTYSREGR